MKKETLINEILTLINECNNSELKYFPIPIYYNDYYILNINTKIGKKTRNTFLCMNNNLLKYNQVSKEIFTALPLLILFYIKIQIQNLIYSI